MADQVRRIDEVVPRLNRCGDVGRYPADYIEAQMNQLRATTPAASAAASAWRHTSEKLDALARRVRGVAEELAESWQSEDAMTCQRALQRIERAARALAARAHEMHRFTDRSVEAIEHATTTFTTESGPGRFRAVGLFGGGVVAGRPGSSVLGNLGGGLDSALDAAGLGSGPSRDEIAQRHLRVLNDAYRGINPTLPSRISAELPVIEVPAGTSRAGRPEPVTPGGGLGEVPAGGSVGGAPPGGVSLDGAGAVPGPAGRAGTPAEGWQAPVSNHPDGTTGGLAGAPPALGAAGAAGGGGPGGGPPGAGVPANAVSPAGMLGPGAVGGRAGAAGGRAGAVGGPAKARGGARPGATGGPGRVRSGMGAIGMPKGGDVPRAAAPVGRGRGGASGSGLSAVGAGGAGGRSAEDRRRHCDVWLSEDDLWGVGGVAAPSVIA